MVRVLLLMLIAVPALADTLEPETCAYLNPTTGVCSQAQLVFNADASTITVNGIQYSGEGFPASREYVNSPFYAEDGSLVLVSAVITYHSKYVSAGRAHYYRHFWTLDSGSVTTP